MFALIEYKDLVQPGAGRYAESDFSGPITYDTRREAQKALKRLATEREWPEDSDPWTYAQIRIEKV